METSKQGMEMHWPETIWTKKFSFEKDDGPQLTKLLGVELAPINIPLKRRLEALSVAFWSSGFLLATTTFFYQFYLLFTQYFWIPLLLFAWIYYDRNTPKRGGRSRKWVQKLKIWRQYVDYFPIRLVKTTNLDPSKNYLFASHPHGIICCGAWGSFATEAAGFRNKFPGLNSHMLTLDMNFNLPIYREYLMAGGICSASRESMNYLLSQPKGGHVAIIVPGGAKEAFYARPGHETILYLKQRKGFVRVALENGSPLVPVFSFGENDVYDQVSNEGGSKLRKVQNFLQSMTGVAPVIILGRGLFQYTFGYLPQRKPITVVVGAPIEFQKTTHPTKEQVDEIHEKYIENLVQLFEKYKGRYGHANDYLKII